MYTHDKMDTGPEMPKQESQRQKLSKEGNQVKPL